MLVKLDMCKKKKKNEETLEENIEGNLNDTDLSSISWIHYSKHRQQK